jgi:hypothetical protein
MDTTLLPDSDSIRQAVNAYRPKVLSPEVAEQVLPRLRELTLLASPRDLKDATNLLGSGCRLIADTFRDHGSEVDKLMTEHRVALWSHQQTSGMNKHTMRNHLTHLGHLVRAAKGEHPRRASHVERPLRPVYDVDALIALASSLTSADAGAAAVLLAAAGAGLVPAKSTGGTIRSTGATAWVSIDGIDAPVEPAWVGVAAQLDGADIDDRAWRRGSAAAARTAVGALDRHTVDRTWVLSRLKRGGPAGEVLRVLGRGYDAVSDAVCLLPEASDVEIRRRLRG